VRWHFKPYGEEQFLIEVGIELKTKLKSTVFSRRLKPARQLFATSSSSSSWYHHHHHHHLLMVVVLSEEVGGRG